LLKLFFLSAHYSHPIDFSFKKIEEVKKQKKIFYDFFDRVDFKEQTEQTVESTKDIKKIDEMCAKFEQAMDDDFNMPKGLAALFELVDFGSKLASSDKESALEYADKKLTGFLNIFGLNRKQNKDIPKEIRFKAKERYLARKNKDFKKADKLRDEIEAQIPYALADTANAFTFIAKHLPEEQ
jgi:cysteinyl-tRNA synthetase